MVPRLNAEERRGFAKYATALDREMGYPGSRQTPKEPALGTLAQRLDIIARRLRDER